MTTVIRLAAGLFLIWHGVVHVIMWAVYSSASWDPRHSWLLGDARPVVIPIAALSAALFTLAGVTLLLDTDWWPYAAVAAAAVSLALMLLTCNIRWLWGIALNAAVVAFALRTLTR
ncbi:MAG: hypothetical protein AB7L91_10110 [Dehalococcoidia bacterium]